ncbi:hypothetical protein OJ253_3334 [Cryptosporidium canis]|uniref:Uncharacterized protein n=1 Tax=Cryptosporidium canis TaxID=195482 RepID=A0A9D5DEK7_9CRYT|nr:hypothetical protein OJ253_3334 [Cryptosporidium canis]
MYREQFQILESLLGRSAEQEIWSIYSLCNHSSKFGGLDECRNILRFFVKYLQDEGRTCLRETELVYLRMGDVLSDEVKYKLVYESDLLSSGMESGSSNLYGIVSKRSDSSVGTDNYMIANTSQFASECEDINKLILAKNILPNSLWTSKFSGIYNTESYMHRGSNGAASLPISLDQSDMRCKTEPYPVLFKDENPKLSIHGECQNSDGRHGNEVMSSGTSTDPYPRKNELEDGGIGIDCVRAGMGDKGLEKGKASIQMSDEPKSLFNDDDDDEGNVDREVDKGCLGESAQMDGSRAKSVKRRKTSKPKDREDSKENVVDFDPLEVEPIKYSKVKREKMYKDAKTGYLVVEDDVDFVMEKENKVLGQAEESSQVADSSRTRKAVRGKKSQTLNSSTSKQQTLTSFFKIIKPSDTTK